MERDAHCFGGRPAAGISIHALRMERDATAVEGAEQAADFYPRAPHGARRMANNDVYIWDVISIHALRMERDAVPRDF